MIAVSTAWNAARHAGYASAVGELLALGHASIALDGAALHPDAAAALRTVRAAKGEIVALFAPPPGRTEPGSVQRFSTSGLVAPRPEERAPAVAAALAAARAAMDAGTTRVVLRVGELPEVDASRETRWLDRLVREGRTDALAREIDAALAASRKDRGRFVEALCRALFELARAAPDVRWLMETPASTSGFPLPDEAEIVFGELPGRRLGYWHDAGHAARLAALSAVPAQEWLSRLGPRAGGATIVDWSPSGGGLPPGAGVVEWAALRGQLTAAMPRVLRLDPSFPAPLLADALREAASLGF
jgi:sugar phosphate isomerase/epimerase